MTLRGYGVQLNGMKRTQKKVKYDNEIFKTIFRDHWVEFKTKYFRYATEMYEEPVQKMLGCGEKFNGYNEHVCMNCGLDRRIVPLSCKSCFCLSCAKKYVDDFVCQVSAMLHVGVVYRHIVLTLPEQLRNSFYKERSKGDLLSAFMRCGYECLEDVVGKIKRMLFSIQMMTVLQDMLS